MALGNVLRSLFTFGAACPRCQEALRRQRIFTVPFDERLDLVTRLLHLGRAKDDAIRPEIEALMSGRGALPKDVASGVRASLDHCSSCNFGALDLELLQDGKPAERKRHGASTAAYAMLDQFLGKR